MSGAYTAATIRERRQMIERRLRQRPDDATVNVLLDMLLALRKEEQDAEES